MGARIKANFICHFKGFWRKSSFWPILFICAVAWFSGLFHTEGDFFNLWTEFHVLIEIIALVLILLIGLAHGKDEKERKIVLRSRSLPHTYFEDFLGSWFALWSYVILILIGSIFIYGLVNAGSFVDLIRAQNITNTNDEVIVAEDKDAYVLKSKNETLEKNESFAFIGFILSGKNNSGLSSAKISAWWIQGDEKEKVTISMKAARTSIVPKSEKNYQTLVIPKKINTSSMHLWIPQSYLFQEQLSYAGTYTGFLFNFILRLFLFAGLVTALGKKMALETGVLVVCGILCASFLISKMGDDIIDQLNKKSEIYEKTTTGFKQLWWEELLLVYNKNLPFLDKLPELLKPSKDSEWLKEKRWIETPFQNGDALKSFLLLLVLVFLCIPLSRTKIP